MTIARVGAELARPERVADDGDLVLAELVLAGKKRAAERRLDAEDLEVAGRHPARRAAGSGSDPPVIVTAPPVCADMKSKTVLSFCQSRKFSVEMPLRSPCGGFSSTRTMRSAPS